MKKLSVTVLSSILALALVIPSAFASPETIEGTVETLSVVSMEEIQPTATPVAETTVGTVGTTAPADSVTATPTTDPAVSAVTGTTEVKAEPSASPTASPSSSPATTPAVTPEAAKDVAKELEATTGEAYTKGFHVQISLTDSVRGLPSVPSFKVQLADGDGKIVSTITASYTNFDQEKGVLWM